MMKTFDIGTMSEANAKKAVKALQGKTYMNFQVDWGIGPGGCPVSISTPVDYPDEEILTMAIHVLIQDLAEKG